MPVVDKGTTLAINTSAVGGLIDWQPFVKVQGTEDETELASTVELRGGTLPSWQNGSGVAHWSKTDVGQDALRAFVENTPVTALATYPDGSTQSAACHVVRAGRERMTRRGRKRFAFELAPVGDVTEADGA